MVCEATYGDTDRQDASPTQRRKLLRTEVLDATKRRGVLLIPSFAVERTQELLVDLVGLMQDKEIPNTPIFINSPLATKASAVFERYAGEMEDGEALRRGRMDGKMPKAFSDGRSSRSTSPLAIANLPTPALGTV